MEKKNKKQKNENENDESTLCKDLSVPLIYMMIWRRCPWPLPRCWRQEIRLADLSNTVIPEQLKGQGIRCADLRYLKGQHFSWIAYERIVFSGQTNKKCTKRQAFWRRMGASLYETTLGLFLISPRRVKSDRWDVTNAQKVSMVQWRWK